MNLDPPETVALWTLGIEGIDPGALRDHLWNRHRIHCVAIGRPDIAALRITPNVYTTIREIDFFADAMEDVIKNGLPA